MVNKIQLQGRDQSILEHLRRYRISTPKVLRRRFFGERKMDAVTSTLRRLKRAELVQSAKLNRNESYLFLTREGAREAGMAPHLAGPLGEQSLVESYGVFGFCCLGSQDREKLMPDEYAAAFEELSGDSVEYGPCYIDQENGVARLGFIAVDQGAGTRVLLRKFRKWVGTQSQSGLFRQYLLDDAILLGVATSHPSKRDELVRLAAKTELPVRLLVEVVPSLAGLTSRAS